MPDRTYSLDRPLPADVLVRGNTVWARYRQYPVFSGRWLRGRSLLFAAVIAVFALVTAFGTALATRDNALGLLAGGHLFVAFLLMATAGPAMATWVRYRSWPASRERRAVVLAVLLGIGASFLADRWASGYVEREVESALVEAGLATANKPVLSDTQKRAALVVNVGVLLVVYGLFGGGLALRAYFSEHRRWAEDRQRRELSALREQKQQSELRLGVLQAQVEPHFLFNTLASVRALVRQDPAQAEATLDALVDYLRATIPRLRGQGADLDATLGRQLDLCERYLALMQIRMGGRLSCVVACEESLRERPFPPLVLITLVENAIKHGIEPRRGPGRVEVRAGRRGAQLVVSVVDDGAGLSPGLGHGTGLANVREQLANRFGARAAFSLRSLAGGGTVAEISLDDEVAA